MQTILETVSWQFTFTHGLLMQQTEGIIHAESLLQPPFGGNCLNWVMGHLTGARHNICKMMGVPSFWQDAAAVRYARGSAPITTADDAGIVDFGALRDLFAHSQSIMLPAIERLTEADLKKPFREKDTAFWLARFAFHEAYHTGQAELLRQLAGKADAVF